MAELHKWTILVVSKNRSVRKVVNETLSESKNRIIFTSSIKDFFEKLLGEAIDLIIFDPRLPGLKAIDALSIAKDCYCNIPSLLLDDGENFDVLASLLAKGEIYRVPRPLQKDYLEQLCMGVSKRKGHGSR